MKQANSGQRNAFQLGASTIPTPVTSIDTDGLLEYHKRLKKMIKASEDRERKKYIEQVREIEQISAPEDNAIIKQAVSAIAQEVQKPVIDFALIQQMQRNALMRMEAILAYYERMRLAQIEMEAQRQAALAIARRKKQDDEIIILLSLL